MGRAPCCEKMGLKKGPWTPQEDKILIDHIEKYGHGNWRALPKQSGLLRCGKSCRLRWTNYLRPDIKRGNFTKEEEENIIKLHEMMGNRWSAIAAKLPGRTDNEIKNVWHTHLKKRAAHNKCSKSETTMNSSSINSTCQEFDQNSPTYSSSTTMWSPQQSSTSSDFSSASDSSIFNQSLTIEANNINGIKDEEEDMMGLFEIDESFWSEELASSDFISNTTNNDQLQQLQFPQSDSTEPVFEYDLDQWYSLFIGSGGLLELPEF